MVSRTSTNLERKESGGGSPNLDKRLNVILSSSAHVFVQHLRFKDSLVIRVLVQELQDLHQALDVPTRTEEGH